MLTSFLTKSSSVSVGVLIVGIGSGMRVAAISRPIADSVGDDAATGRRAAGISI